jgi:hypothetical protein
LEGAAQEKAVRCVLDNIRVNLACYAANPNGQVIDTAYSPVPGPVGPFHLDKVIGIDVDAEVLNQILPDNDDLRSGVVDGRHADRAVK